MTKWVYVFKRQKAIQGCVSCWAVGANLAEMSRIGLPVPPVLR